MKKYMLCLLACSMSMCRTVVIPSSKDVSVEVECIEGELYINHLLFTGSKPFVLDLLKEPHIDAPSNALVLHHADEINGITVPGQGIYVQEKRGRPWKQIEFMVTYNLRDSFPKIVSVLIPQDDSLVVRFWRGRDMLHTQSYRYRHGRWTPQ